MSYKINLIYWQENKNFGDSLAPYIISKLSNYRISSKRCALSWPVLFKFVLKYPNKIKELNNYVLPFQSNLLSTGSIINLGNKRSKIWGSGFMNESDEFPGGKIFALRGKYSAEKINKSKKKILCEALGDPAILLPLIYSPDRNKKFELGIVPHWREVEYFKKKFSNFLIIDTRTDNVEDIIDKILSCKKIISTSLHGLIVAHTYNIPALWIKRGFINTDGFKFKDYFNSVGIPEYDGFINFEKILLNNENLMNFFIENNKISLPLKDLHKLRNDLIKKAPFKLKSEFQCIKEYL